MRLPEREPCPLCEVTATGSWTLDNKTVEAAVIAKNEAALAFLKDDRADGYAFVIPKRHARTILELQPDESHAEMDLLVALCRALSEELAPTGINIVQNNGVAGEQSVPHVHFHVVPRTEGDEWSPPAGQHWTGQLAPLAERKNLANRLAARFS